SVGLSGAEATTDAEGRYALKNVPRDAAVQIAATDYTSQTLAVPAALTLDAVLRPNAVQGTILDATTSKPISDAVVLAMPAPPGQVDATMAFTGTAISMT